MNEPTQLTTLPRADLMRGDERLWQREKWNNALEGCLERLAPISLSQMDDVALLNRTDTKFVMLDRQLVEALFWVGDMYRVLEVEGWRQNTYRTLYFDTPDMAFFRDHHAGKPNRYKVRSREYVNTEMTFLEIKYKEKSSRTIKSRLRTADFMTALDADADEFLHDHSPYAASLLAPTLWAVFTRITLVNKHRRERLTLDHDLHFFANNAHIDLSGIAIAEVKQSGHSRESEFMQHMRLQGIRPAGFSKYCVGMSMLYTGLKHNNFKPTLLQVDHLLKGAESYAHIH